VKRGREGVPPPGGSRRAGAGLPQEGIVQGGHQHRRRGGQLQETPQDGGEERLGIPGTPREEAVVGGPVPMLTTGGADEPRDGMPAQTGELAEGQTAGPASDA
jgi:hypothetical protein